MSPNLIYPIFAMFVLTLVVAIRLFLLRVRDIRTGTVRLSAFRTYSGPSGSEIQLQASRHFSNLFEVPVLFYVICILGIIFSEGNAFVVLAWLYVVARAIHAYIHLGSNNVILRMQSFFASYGVLAAMWVLFLFHQLSANTTV